jgi:hypothetical protein
MKKLKRKATSPQPKAPPKKKMNEVEMAEIISPSSKINVFKVDVISCSSQSISSLELGAEELENIWTDSLLRELSEIGGYTSFKAKNNTEIRIQYQLAKPMSLRSIATEAEFNHERTGARGTEVLRCRVVGLGEIRIANIGEIVKATVILPNFEITPEQAIEWISKFGKVQEGHR